MSAEHLFAIGLSHEVWFEHIFPFFSSNQLLTIRFVNRDLSELIFSFIIKFKKEFKIQVGFPNSQLVKIVHVFLNKLQQLKTIIYEDYDILEDFCLTDEGIKELHPLTNIEIVNLKNLSTCNGLFIKDWINLKSPLLYSLKNLHLNGIDDEFFSLLNHFTNLKVLSIEPTNLRELDSSIVMNLPQSLEKLTLGYQVYTSHLKQIAKQCPNLVDLSVSTSEELRNNQLNEELTPMKNLHTLKLISSPDIDYDGYMADLFCSLKSLGNLTSLQVTWSIQAPGSVAFDNLKHLGTLKNLKSLHLTIGCEYYGGDSSYYESTFKTIVETICKLDFLDDLSLQLFSDDEMELLNSDFLKNSPQLSNLKRLSLAGNNSFITPLLKHFHVSSLTFLDVFSDQTVDLKDIFIPDQHFPNLELICFECKTVNDGFCSKMLNQVDLLNIKSLNISSIELNDLKLISQMTNLEALFLSMSFIPSFKNIKLPKLLKTLKFVNCEHLTGMEEDFFENFIFACPLLENLEFNMCTQLTDSIAEKICNWILVNSIDLKKIFFIGSQHLTNNLIYSFKELTTCNLVMFQNCIGMHYSTEMSEILRNHEFIQVFGGSNNYDFFLNFGNDIEKSIIQDSDLTILKTIIQNFMDSKQYYKAFLYLHANIFKDGDQSCLYRSLMNSDLETKWFFYFSFLRCHNVASHYHTNEILSNVLAMLSDMKLNDIEEKRKTFFELDLLSFHLSEENNYSMNDILPHLIHLKRFETAANFISIYNGDGYIDQFIDLLTEDDCFQFEYLHGLLNVNDYLTEKVVKLSPFFQNCSSFIQELKENNIIEIPQNDPKSLVERVPSQFKNAHLIELIVPLIENENGKKGESEIFEAFGYRWSLNICEEEEWTQTYLKLVSTIPDSNNISRYELLGGNDGDSVEISFMLLNFDNNPHNYFSGRGEFNQAKMDYFHSIRSHLIQKYTENSYKILVGLKLLTRHEKIPCPFLSPKYSIHKLSFRIPLDLSGYLYTNFKLHSDPILEPFGTRWIVKFEKDLKSGRFGVYLILASFDFFDEKAALHECKVVFFFANKNLHPDSTTETMRKTYKDMSSSVGTDSFKHPELFKPEEEIVNGERFERFDISLVLELKEIK